MEIKYEVLERMHCTLLDNGIETGGILGRRNDDVITDIAFDSLHNKLKCTYSPNVKFLNECIQSWSEQNITFKGIFHTHFFNVDSLSEADILYINRIMMAMPDEINELFFPIYVFPKKTLVAYKANRTDAKIKISMDNTKVINGGNQNE